MAAQKHNEDVYDDVYDDEIDFDEDYFMMTYQPLSNLPTPPPSCRDSIASLGSRDFSEPDELSGSALFGPAVHLVNLIPPKASLTTPQVSTVHEILTRANLPSETIALAVCILDSLNAKFSQAWRLSCPLAPPPPPSQLLEDGASTGEPLPETAGQTQHIDAVRPEVIVLAALTVAVKFLEDWQEPSRHYATAWGGGQWTCEQLNVTERCIMESLGYRIMPLWDRSLIRDALADMERAATPANLGRRSCRFGSSAMSRFGSTASAGPAAKVLQTGASRQQATNSQLTPDDTPKFGSVAWSKGSSETGSGVLPQAASAGGPAGGLCLDPLQMRTPFGGKMGTLPLPSPPAEEEETER